MDIFWNHTLSRAVASRFDKKREESHIQKENRLDMLVKAKLKRLLSKHRHTVELCRSVNPILTCL